MSAVRVHVRDLTTGKLLASQVIDDGDSKVHVGDRTLKMSLANTPPMAVCFNDGEPLVATFEFPKFEFICQVCDQLYTYFGPRSVPSTPALEARQIELKAAYAVARKAREEARDA